MRGSAIGKVGADLGKKKWRRATPPHYAMRPSGENGVHAGILSIFAGSCPEELIGNAIAGLLKSLRGEPGVVLLRDDRGTVSQQSLYLQQGSTCVQDHGACGSSEIVNSHSFNIRTRHQRPKGLFH